MSNSMSYGGVDLSSATYGLTVLQSDFSARPSINTGLVEFARLGGAHGIARIAPKQITVNVLVQGSSFSNLLSKIDSLNAILDTDSDKALALDHISGRYWNVRHSGDAISIHEDRINAMQFQLSFIAADPYAYSTTESVFTLTDGDSDGVIETTITPAGSALAEPVYVLTKPVNNYSIKISNATTGQEIFVAWENASDLVKVDTSFMSLYPVYTSNDAGVTWSEQARMVSGAYYNMRLAPGIANALTIWANTATITYRARYL